MIIPEDQDQRNIIDKLANFVARNGPQFEELTKEKQRANPKFQFLYGGDYHAYYKWKVHLEGQQIKAQELQQNSAQGAEQVSTIPSWQQAVNAYQQSQAELRPTAHIQAKPQPPSDLNLSEFDLSLGKLMDSCTKDNIQSGKSWIINNAKSVHHCRHIAEHLLNKVVSERNNFPHMLHIIYLINDVGHHCSRKNLTDLQKSIGDVVGWIVGITDHSQSDENKEKLTKVLKIWETNKVFLEDVMETLKHPEKAYEQYEAKHKEEQQQEQQQQQQQQQEHQQQQALQQQPPQQQPQPQLQQPSQQQQLVGYGNFPPPQQQGQPQQPQWQQFQPAFGQFQGSQPQSSMPYQYQQIQQDPNHIQNSQDRNPEMEVNRENSEDARDHMVQSQEHQGFMHTGHQGGGFGPRGPGQFGPQHGQWGPRPDFNQPLPRFQDPMFQPRPAPAQFQQFDYGHQRRPQFGDPGAPPQPQTFDYDHGRVGPDIRPGMHPMEVRDPTIPMAPYHDLPAGLIVPLVQLWDCEYKPINPQEIRLPVPQPPSDRLLAAVEAFYSPPSHDRPRDSNGWEKNGLFEFFKAKLKYIKDKPRNIAAVVRSPSPPPVVAQPPPPLMRDSPQKSPQRRSLSPRRSPRRRRSLSRSRSRSRSRPRSPRRRSRSRSRERRRSRSSSFERKRSRSSSRSRSRSPVPIRSRSPRRSPTPPTGFVMFESKTLESKIEESNVGHQMLKKMGWGGKGLGREERGIQEPIKGGEVREKGDMFKGVGVSLDDPFESYRRNKSYTYNRPRKER